MAPKTPLIIFFLFFFFFKYSDSSKLTTRLIHHDSIFSPFYNASETTADRAWRATRSSFARHAYLSSAKAGIQDKLVEAMYHNAFYVNFSIGNPPVPQLAIMDTGSNFLWVKCLPCSPCWPMKGITYFDPAVSSTYAPRPCTAGCKRCFGRWPWSAKHCMYTKDYRSGYRAKGIYAKEQLTFRTSDNQTITFPNISFGCGSSLTEAKALYQDFNGIFGLGVGDPDALLTQESFFNQFSYKFSYCIAGLSDPNYPDNRLAFGDAAWLGGDPTPLYTEDSLYKVHLVNISIGTKMLDINIEVFRKMSLKRGVVIDSGVTLLHLYTEAYDAVKAEIEDIASRSFTSVPPTGPLYEMCYRGRVDQDTIGFPSMELHFAGDASFGMETYAMFKQIDDKTFCLAVVRSETVTSIGLMAQQDYNVGFDLKSKLMYLEHIGDCNVLYQ